MRRWTLVGAALVHNGRSNLGILLGVMVACATVVGSLLVGDATRASLRARVDQRLGGVTHALDTGPRTFREALATPLEAAPALVLDGVLARADGARVQGRVRLYGVDDRYFQLVNVASPAPSQHEDDLAIDVTRSLARSLALEPGDVAVFRTRRPDSAPEELPLADREKAQVSLRVEVRRVADDERLEAFSLRPARDRVFNAFVPLSMLQAAVGAPGRANLLLGGYDDAAPVAKLRAEVTPDDLGLSLVEAGGAVELRSRHVFIEPGVSRAAERIPGAARAFGYLANELRAGERAAPYAVVAGLDAFDRLGPDEVVLTDWLAEDLSASVGGYVDLKYFALDVGGRLVERSAALRVREIAPVESLDRSLLPAIPGIAGKEHCRDWEPGFPFDATRVRDRDEDYWKRHGGTPKAVVSFRTAQALWGGRFGDRTLVRWSGARLYDVRARLMAELDPGTLGLRFEAVRAEGLDAARGASDLGGLFLGFGLFLVAAALLLAGVLFSLGISRRGEERRALMAMGFTGPMIRNLYLAEAAVLSVVGAVLGLPLGMLYTGLVLKGISGPWRGAADLPSIVWDVRASSVAVGLGATILCSFVATALTLRSSRAAAAARPRAAVTVALIGLAGGLVSGAWGLSARNAAGFFASGFCLLVAGVAGVLWWLSRLDCGEVPRTIGMLAVRGLARHPGRSLAVLALVAAPTFLVVAVGASRPDLPDLTRHDSPSGGYAYVARTTLPVFDEPPGTTGFRVRAGDDASCLSLEQAARPELLGIDPARMKGRFRFLHGRGWDLLGDELPDGVLPVVADETTVRWMLHKGPGDEIEYIDEHGQAYRARIAGVVADSVLQGRLVMAESHFVARYPGEGGRRFFLGETGPGEESAAMAAFAERQSDRGPDVESTAGLLARLHAVEETYLAIFGVLGAIGLMLGVLGLGALVLRQAAERRGELALLVAAGFMERRAVGLLLLEHVILFVAGLAIGLGSALVAVAPQLGHDLPVGTISWQVGGVLASGLMATALAGWLVARVPPMTALRSE